MESTDRQSRARHRREPIRVLDLFAGAGGLTQGFHSVRRRFRCVRAVEHDLAAAASYAHTFGKDLVYPGSIQDWLTEEHVPDADVVVGGPPCQGFSTLGKQDAEDLRNILWQDYVRTVAKAQPQYFILENVPAFLTSPQFARFRNATYRGRKLGDYWFTSHILNAADYGAAQARKRVVVIGYHRDLPDPGAPLPTHVGRHVTVAETLLPAAPTVTDTELPDSRTEFAGHMFPGAFKTTELHLTRSYSQTSLARFRSIPPGGNRFDIPDALLSECWKKHTTGSGDVMGRLSLSKPSVTIRTEFFKPEKGRYLHPTEHRALTHYEAALLQGFPPDHQWVGSKVSIARQIGNAVPIPLAQAIARHLATAIDGR